MVKWNNLQTVCRFRLVLLFSLALSIGGVLVAAYVTKDPQDGGRGGALAVAVSFAVLFLSRGYGSHVYRALTAEAAIVKEHIDKLRKAESTNSSIDANTKIDALLSKARVDSNVQEIQNTYLTWSSVIGTTAWGFGDVLAGYLV